MNIAVKTNLTAAAVAISLSVAPDATATAPKGRQIAPSDLAMRGRDLIQQFAMSFGNQPYAASMALPRP